MRIVGIIAEYNPLHRGHIYQLEKAREMSGAEGAVIVMSGSFVQRGEPALTDKYRRAEAALKAGADLVLELPPAYAAGSAENFARGGVSMLKACGAVTDLAFGAETADLAALTAAADLLLKEDAAMKAQLAEALRAGLPYPKAMAQAAAVKDPAAARILASPNNTLAVEYIKAVKRLDAPLALHAVPRLGSSHGEDALPEDGSCASAGAIRRALREGISPEMLEDQLAPGTAGMLEPCLFPEDISAALSAVLLRADKARLMQAEDMTEELAARILRLKPYTLSFEELADAPATKAYTKARVRRALLHVLLDIPRGAGRKEPCCLKILGLNASSPVPSLIREKAFLPVITKAADDAAELAADMRFAADVYDQAVYAKTGVRLPDDYRRSPVILKNS